MSPTPTPESHPEPSGAPETHSGPPEIPDAPDGWPTADPGALHRARTDGGLRALIARAMWRRDYQPGAEASTSGLVYEVADRIASEAVPEIERQVREQVAQKILADQQRREKTHVPPGRPDALARQYGERKGMQRAAEIARGGS